MLNYKKPTIWVSILCVTVILTISIGCVTNRIQPTSEEPAVVITDDTSSDIDAFTADDAIDMLVSGIMVTHNGIEFYIPYTEDRFEAVDWNIWISGRSEYEDGFSRSEHFLSEISETGGWEIGPGIRIYTIPVTSVGNYTELIMDITLDGVNRSVDLLEYLWETPIGEYVVAYLLPDKNDDIVSKLLLAQPIKKGEEGIWQVVMWMDGEGVIYDILTNEGYYENLQQECDNGLKPSLLNPTEVALEYVSVYMGLNKEALRGFAMDVKKERFESVEHTGVFSNVMGNITIDSMLLQYKGIELGDDLERIVSIIGKPEKVTYYEDGSSVAHFRLIDIYLDKSVFSMGSILYTPFAVDSIAPSEVICIGVIELDNKILFTVSVSALSGAGIFVALHESPDITDAEGIVWTKYNTSVEEWGNPGFVSANFSADTCGEGTYYVYIGSSNETLTNVSGTLRDGGFSFINVPGAYNIRITGTDSEILQNLGIEDFTFNGVENRMGRPAIVFPTDNDAEIAYYFTDNSFLYFIFREGLLIAHGITNDINDAIGD